MANKKPAPAKKPALSLPENDQASVLNADQILTAQSPDQNDQVLNSNEEKGGKIMKNPDQSTDETQSNSSQSTVKKVELSPEILALLGQVVAQKPVVLDAKTKAKMIAESREIIKIAEADEVYLENIMMLNCFGNGLLFSKKDALKVLRKFVKNPVFTALSEGEVSGYQQFAEIMTESTNLRLKLNNSLDQLKKQEIVIETDPVKKAQLEAMLLNSKPVDIALITPDRVAFNCVENVDLKSILIDKWGRSKEDKNSSQFQQPELSLAVRFLLQLNAEFYGSRGFNVGDLSTYQHISSTPANFNSILDACEVGHARFTDKDSNVDLVNSYIQKHCKNQGKIEITPERKFTIDFLLSLPVKYFHLLHRFDDNKAEIITFNDDLNLLLSMKKEANRLMPASIEKNIKKLELLKASKQDNAH